MNKVEIKYHNLNGIKIPLNPKIISPKLEKTIVGNNYEAAEFKELHYFIQENENILEVGAGIGYISAICRKMPQVNHISVFEANPKLIDFIKLIHKENNIENVVVKHGVLANNYYKKDINFFVREDFWASSLNGDAYGYKEKIKVPVFNFNKVINELKPTLIICDIEGGELELFKNSDLAGVKKVYLEVHQNVLGRNGMKELFEIFHNRGFHYDQWHSSKGVVLFSNVLRDEM